MKLFITGLIFLSAGALIALLLSATPQEKMIAWRVSSFLFIASIIMAAVYKPQ